jgi:hypothetical protein
MKLEDIEKISAMERDITVNIYRASIKLIDEDYNLLEHWAECQKAAMIVSRSIAKSIEIGEEKRKKEKRK